MAITINQSPTSPNYSISDLVYVISSDNTSRESFSFVVDIYADGIRVARRFKQENGNGSVVLDLSDIINANLDYDYDALGNSINSTSTNATKTFSIRFGEEYISSNQLTIFPDLATSADLIVTKGILEYNTGDYNQAVTIPSILTDVPRRGIRYRNGQRISVASNSGGVITHNVVNMPLTGTSHQTLINGVTFNFELYNETPFLGETVFVWANSYGGWDYYNATQEHRKGNSSEKTSFSQSVIDYNATTIASNREPNNSSVFRRRTRPYITNRSSSYSVDTEWLNQEKANWLEFLFDSPATYIKQDNLFIPITITNNVDSYTTRRNQDLVSYTIEYELANNKRRLI